jgi:shikimate kinase/3-dehydroquinate synthase
MTMKPVLLQGPPTAGKSTLARALAARLGRRVLDVDAQIETRTGASIPALFARVGEGGFRRIESEIVRECLEARDGPVVALGGGALTDRALRRESLERATILSLAIGPETVLSRAAEAPETRPLLHRADEEQVRRLLDARADGYAEAHAVIDGAQAAEPVLAQALAELARVERERTTVVPLGVRTYRVSFGSIGTLAERVRGLDPSGTLAVTDARVREAPGVRAALAAMGLERVVCFAGNGDAEKDLAGAERVWDAALDAGIDRRGALVAVGGGVISDLTGFAAATLLRGVRFVIAPTTVLAMADASVGGKTAVDHPRGKNLLGAFHQPSLVLCDAGTLATLPLRERVAGLAEVVKIAAIAEAPLLDLLELHADALARGSLEPMPELLAWAVRVKARIVAADEREEGARAALNFGHTLGHAIEQAAGYALPHGECVALGMRAALALGVAMEQGSADTRARVERLLDRLGLPRRAPDGLDARAIDRALRMDKKGVGDQVRVVLCPAVGSHAFARIPREHMMDVGLRAIAGG